MENKLNFLEASFLIIIVMIAHVISDLPNDIINNYGSASISEMLKVIYFPKASLISILCIFSLVALIANQYGKNSVVKVNTLIVPQVLISVIIIFISSFNKFDYNAIFPILGNLVLKAHF